MLQQQLQIKQRPQSHQAVHSKITRTEYGQTQQFHQQGKLIKGPTYIKTSTEEVSTNILINQGKLRPITTNLNTKQLQFMESQDPKQPPRTAPAFGYRKRLQKSGNNLTRSSQVKKKLLPPDITLIESIMFPSIYFAKNAETIPYSKCCNAPIHIELAESGNGKLVCNSPTCGMNTLTEFLINFDDGQKLWKDRVIFREASDRDKIMRNKISRLIISGQFKHRSLAREIKKTSKEIAILFDKPQRRQSFQEKYEPSPFLTDIRNEKKNEFSDNQFNNFVDEYEQQNQNEIKQSEKQLYYKSSQNFNEKNFNSQKNIDQYNEYKQKFSQGLVMESKIFNKDFRINEQYQQQQHFSPVSANKFYQTNYQSINNPTIHFKQQTKSAKQYRTKKVDEIKNKQENEEEKTLLDIKNMINEILE